MLNVVEWAHVNRDTVINHALEFTVLELKGSSDYFAFLQENEGLPLFVLCLEDELIDSFQENKVAELHFDG